MKKSIKSNGGYSLVMAVGIVALLLVFSGSTMVLITEQLKNQSNYEDSTQAYYNALNGIEEAKWVISQNDRGFNFEGIRENNEQGLETRYEIIGTADQENSSVDGYNLIPMPGSGDVAENCDINQPPQEPIEIYDQDGNQQGVVQAIDHPCNWSKLNYSDSVEIPLFAFDQQQQRLINPNGLENGGFEFTDFQLKVRTACKTFRIDERNSDQDNIVYMRDKWGNKICEDDNNINARYELDIGLGRFPNERREENNDIYLVRPTVSEGDTIISWQIIADECYETGNSCQLLMNNSTRREVGNALVFRDERTNSEITEKDINQGTRFFVNNLFSVLEGVSLSFQHQGLSTYLNNQAELIEDFLTQVSSPTLNLTVVHPLLLREDGFDPLVAPYLEYQIIYQTNNGTSIVIPNNETIVVSEGFQGDFKQTLEVRQSIQSNTLNFVIEN